MSDQNSNQSPASTPENVSLLVAYLFSWLGGLIVLVAMAGGNKKLKFHAWQSIGLGVVAVVALIVLNILINLLYFIPFIWVLGNLAGLAYFGCCVFLAVMAYQGKTWEFPVIAEIVRPLSEK